ncbi:MAG: hypothetical protein QNJ78_06955 [Gammaproteobacteria bacterium]|nr:hypothetical protein [Gammaproteobacteria bacterium]
MTGTRHTALEQFFAAYGQHPGVPQLQSCWSKLQAGPARNGPAGDPIELYASATELLEAALWQAGCPDSALALSQRLYREMEALISQNGDDRRFSFIVVIPLADRPQHLKSCLNSLLELCRTYRYGGWTDGHCPKLKVLVADDSQAAENIERHRQLLEDFSDRGIETHYFGQAEQLQQLGRLPRERKQGLSRIIGDHPSSAFHHKGASITRNITLLKLLEMAQNADHCLFWFLDSDQEFQVNTAATNRSVQAINYFHHLDRIFSTTDCRILTGKVVGDPPVSPAVMAGNFLQDVTEFLAEMARQDPQQTCRFHAQADRQEAEAAYHDLATLFGFQPTAKPFEYPCRLALEHDHARCFADFADKLNRFFDGEHPTRRTWYEHRDLMASVRPARTVYTGNYVLRADALETFIPFAALKLRMAGPVLGRILKAEQGGRFVSANLPMLHGRTLEELGQSEFRPDIERSADLTDLSGEFERQFYGDVMLFSIERLIEQGFPTTPLAEGLVRQTLREVEASLRQQYTDIHQQIPAKLDRLRTRLNDPDHWWNQGSEHQAAVAEFKRFIRNMAHNFGDAAAGYRMIHSDPHRRQRLDEILDAIMQFPQDRENWRATMTARFRASESTGQRT